MPSILLLLVVVAIGGVSMVACAVLASNDAKRGQRKFGKRVLLTGLTAAGLFAAVLVALFYWMLLREPPPPGAGLRLSIFGLLVASGIVFLISTAGGAIGYSISHPIAEKGKRPPENPDLTTPTPVDETGNPYQPPSV